MSTLLRDVRYGLRRLRTDRAVSATEVIVNIKRVKEIQAWFQGDYVLILKNGKRFMSGRAYRDVVRRFTARSD